MRRVHGDMQTERNSERAIVCVTGVAGTTEFRSQLILCTELNISESGRWISVHGVQNIYENTNVL